MIDDTFNFLAVTKTLLNIDDEKSDSIINIYIDSVKQSVLNYCNLDVLPSQLNYTVCYMAVDVYNENKIRNAGDVVGNVSSISEDGRTVSFTNGSEFKASIDDKVSRLSELKNYRNLYRK